MSDSASSSPQEKSLSQGDNPSSYQRFTKSQKWLVALVVAFIFFILASPATYNYVNVLTSTIGLNITSSDGCPNLGGVMVHSIIFLFIIRLLLL